MGVCACRRLMLYAYGYMRIDVQAGGALISALVNGVPQQCGQILIL